MPFTKLFFNFRSHLRQMLRTPTPSVVVVLGATGTGKSKLAIKLAQQFNGEIISADSMQVYKGLDIITNKVSEEERRLSPHHLLDFIDPLTDYNVQKYRDEAIGVIESLHNKGKLPIIVGGTHYYIESVLWKVLIDKTNRQDRNCESRTSESRSDVPIVSETTDKLCICERILDDVSTQQSSGVDARSLNWRHVSTATDVLYTELCRVDPDRASTLHPSDRRKIVRSLEVLHQCGVQHSALLVQQRAAEGGSVLGGPLRYPRANTAVFWVHCEQDVLDKRLDDRVDNMLKRGLLDELHQFHEQYNRQRLARLAAVTEGQQGGEGDYEIPKGDGEIDERAGETAERAGETDERAGVTAEGAGEISEGANLTADNASTDCNRLKRNLVDNAIESEIETGSNFIKRAKLEEHDEKLLSDYNNSVTPASKVQQQITTSRTTNKSDLPLDYNQSSHDAYTQGIFQSIGFKEFHDYLIMAPSQRDTDHGRALHDKGVAALKQVTRRYARRQLKWIRNRFLKSLNRQVPSVYQVDGTDPSQWQSCVHEPAVRILENVIEGKQWHDTIQPMPVMEADPADVQGRFDRQECRVCNRVFVGRHQWTQHIMSNNHKKMKEKLCKEAKKKELLLQHANKSPIENVQ